MSGARKSGNTAKPDVSDDMVTKVGAAVGQVAMLRQEYTERVEAAQNDEEREQLADQAQQAAVKVIRDQGISVSEYNEVVTAAEDNPELEAKLLSAARGMD